MIHGDFCWTGDIPDDDEIADAPNPLFSVDFGEEWQHLATRPLMTAVCRLLRSDPTVADLDCSQPCDHGWYADFKIDQWKCHLYVQWIGSDDAADDDNMFEFHAGFRHELFHRLVHRSQHNAKLRILGATIAHAFTSCPYIESIVVYGIGPIEDAGNHGVHAKHGM
ncbi:hypothetical protein [Stieleria varia]|uniref:Uncharacterized protein n=1 Tax=Stieleria varia TaxID=2528005 RepID=A0A5C5ZQ47_9BACT|nr:hypothetical protein [Stieleria varia]TWT89614.1 hypothetical protein Pla52n_67420 [Stieleria varia]